MKKYILPDKVVLALLKHRMRNEKNGNGFGIHLVDVGGVAYTINASTQEQSTSNYIGWLEDDGEEDDADL